MLVSTGYLPVPPKLATAFIGLAVREELARPVWGNRAAVRVFGVENSAQKSADGWPQKLRNAAQLNNQI